MQLTHTKLKYLLTAAELQKQDERGFRGIDLAIQLGVSRASVRKMLLKFIEDGYLSHESQYYYFLTEKGKHAINMYMVYYHKLQLFFKESMELTEFESKECSLSLISVLPVSELDRICLKLSE